MRLIDADSMLNEVSLESIFIPCGKESTELALRQWINKQPTAYDIEKVVEELEEKSDDIPIQYEDNYEKGFDDGIGYAIDIIWKGGV